MIWPAFKVIWFGPVGVKSNSTFPCCCTWRFKWERMSWKIDRRKSKYITYIYHGRPRRKSKKVTHGCDPSDKHTHTSPTVLAGSHTKCCEWYDHSRESEPNRMCLSQSVFINALSTILERGEKRRKKERKKKGKKKKRRRAALRARGSTGPKQRRGRQDRPSKRWEQKEDTRLVWSYYSSLLH